MAYIKEGENGETKTWVRTSALNVLRRHDTLYRHRQIDSCCQQISAAYTPKLMPESCAKPRPATPQQFMNVQLREHLAPDIKWDIQVKRVIHSGQSKFQQVELIESGPFGKVSTQAKEPLCQSCRNFLP